MKGREKQTVGEVYELFESVFAYFFLYISLNHLLKRVQIASELWPIVDTAHESHSEDEEPDTEISLEAQIANEVSGMIRPRSQNPAQRFCKCSSHFSPIVFSDFKISKLPNKYALRYDFRSSSSFLSQS